VKNNFPKLKITDFEADRIAKVKEDLRRKTDRAKYETSVGRQAAFQKAKDANKPVLWRFRKPDGRLEQGSLTCDKLRDVLNQGLFDDPTKFGALSSSYSFSFDASTWQQFRTHSEMLHHVNAQATERCLNAVQLTLQAAVSAAFQTWTGAAAPAAPTRGVQDTHLHFIKSSEQGLLSFTLPSLPGVIMTSERMARMFDGIRAAVDQHRAPRLPPLFSDGAVTCRAGNGPNCTSSDQLHVELFFPAFLSLDLVMRDKEGLQKALESMIFDFYFQQSLAQHLPRA
jgi:hypothetical protein